MVAMDFCFVNTESDDDVLTMLANDRETIPSSWCDGVARQSESEFAVATTIGYLDFQGHQEVMIKCDPEQSMKKIACLLQELRRPRRTIVESSPKGSHQRNEVVENAH